MAKTGLDTFDHVVVLMLENRSFDNMLGYLYSPKEIPNKKFEGLWGKDYWNPVPKHYRGPIRRVATFPTGFSNNPQRDPGEVFQHVNVQLFGNKNGPTRPSQVPAMKGFVLDYVGNGQPGYMEMAQVMGCFPPDAVPVISTLAREFAVFDHWFCDVPTQTIPNRSFFNSAQSMGQVTNDPADKWWFNDAPTIFNRLDEKGLSWRVYYYKHEDKLPKTLAHHWVPLEPFQYTNFFDIEQFWKDVKHGKLPAYSYIEPRGFGVTNDQHPPASVTPGEHLFHQVYDAIRKSNSARGSNARNTLLAFTYDEHGGNFDHVPPPRAVPPIRDPKGQYGFTFDRLGVRVPMVMISAYIEPQTIVQQVHHHTSFIRTLEVKWGLKHLNRRDAHAPTFEKVFNRKTPRDPKTWPITHPNPISHLDNNPKAPLNALQQSYLRLFVSIWKPDLVPDWSRIQTVEDAERLLKKLQRVADWQGNA